MKTFLIFFSVFLAGAALGFHLAEAGTHDELLVCRMLVTQLNGASETIP